MIPEYQRKRKLFEKNHRALPPPLSPRCQRETGFPDPPALNERRRRLSGHPFPRRIPEISPDARYGVLSVRMKRRADIRYRLVRFFIVSFRIRSPQEGSASFLPDPFKPATLSFTACFFIHKTLASIGRLHHAGCEEVGKHVPPGWFGGSSGRIQKRPLYESLWSPNIKKRQTPAAAGTSEVPPMEATLILQPKKNFGMKRTVYPFCGPDARKRAEKFYRTHYAALTGFHPVIKDKLIQEVASYRCPTIFPRTLSTHRPANHRPTSITSS